MSTILTSREFNQDTSGAKRATAKGPVFITDRGEPAHVLMSIGDYARLVGVRSNIVEMLGSAAAARVDFDPPRADIEIRSPDFS